MPKRKHIDKIYLTALLVSGKTQAECAEILGCSPPTINKRVKEYGIVYSPDRTGQKNPGPNPNRRRGFCNTSAGRKPRKNSLLEDDMEAIEAEFDDSWNDWVDWR